MNDSLVLQLDPSPGNARNSEGAFIALKDGRLLFAWSKFVSDSGIDYEPSIIVCRVSDDDGQTWTNEDRILAKPTGDAHNAMSVSLLRLQDGRIALMYLIKKSKADDSYQCSPQICFSDDEMATLSPPIPLTPSTDYHVGNNDRLIQLCDGTLIMPVAQHRFALLSQLSNEGKPQLEFIAPGLIFCFLSRDGGQTWMESTNSFYRAFPDGSGFQEPGVLPLRDGRLWLWARTDWKNGEVHARQWQSFSDDNGSTWSEPEPSVFASPCSPLSMKRIPPESAHGGDLLAVWNDHSGRFPVPQAGDYTDRSPLVCAVSSDDGATWKHHHLLENEPGHGYCYTAIHFTDDAVLLAYCSGGAKQGGQLNRLRMRRILLSEIYADLHPRNYAGSIYNKGFNAPGVTILDPAAGTGAYPLAILEHALAASRARSGSGAVAGAATDLAARLHAFEFLVGPYAVAHLRLTQAVRAAGGHLPPEGAQVFLCDTLESPQAAPPQPSLFVRRLAEEHERARRIKDSVPILVCLGNPPYDRQQRDNADQTQRGGWVRFGDGSTPAPLEDFLAPAREAGFGGHLKNLYNDYVYFWRWAMWKVFEKESPQRAPGGVVCFITASSYLRGPAFVGMRRVMRETFDELWILDLEGDSYGPRPTENVFSIRTGVTIALGIRTSAQDGSTPAAVHHAKITGTTAQKYASLDAIGSLSDLTWQNCPTDWLDPFLPVSDAAYYQWPELTDLFPWQHSGAQWKRTWPIGETEDLLKQRWSTLVSAPANERADLFRETTSRRITNSYMDETTQQRLPAIASLTPQTSVPTLERYAFRSFDRQWILSDIRLCDRWRPPLWETDSSKQVFMTSLLTKILGPGPAPVVAAHVPDMDVFCNRGGKDVIPFWRDGAATQPNVTLGVLPALSEITKAPVRAQDLFAYCYALLSTRAYVETFAEELLLPGPHLPVTRSAQLFARVAALGHELIRLHTFGERDLENAAPPGEVTSGTARNTIAVSPQPENYPQDYAYDESTQTLRVGDGEFAPVSPSVWNYSVSGLQVVRSWLDYRKKEPRGRASSALDEIRPETWSAQLTEELLEVLWTLEHTIAREPEATALLNEVLAGKLIIAAELPQPLPEETQPPTAEESENTAQQTMDL